MGLLAAAGFITGEALMGIGLAVPVAVKHDENAIALFKNGKGGAFYETCGSRPWCSWRAYWSSCTSSHCAKNRHLHLVPNRDLNR